MPPFPNIRVGLTFDLDLWPNDLNANRDRLLIKEAIYLPSLKLQEQSVPKLSVAQGLRDWHDLWPWPLTYWPDYQLGSSTHQGLSTYQVWSFWGKALLSYQLHKVWETDMTFDLDLWPTDLTINRDHLLTKDYLPTKFEASGAKRSGVISCTRLRATDIPTDRPTYRPTCATQYAPPSSKGGINIDVCKTLMPPFPNIWRISLTLDTDLWPTDLKPQAMFPKDWEKAL